MNVPIGTCSLCGGPVMAPAVWMSIIPPVPQCGRCGATAAEHGPVIQMAPAPPVQTWTSSTGTSIVVRNGPENTTGASNMSPYSVDTTDAGAK